jgi:hypothetical protein
MARIVKKSILLYGHAPPPKGGHVVEAPRLADLFRMDDTALIQWRREARVQLEHDPSAELQIAYDQTTQEIVRRAGEWWAKS